MRASSFELLLVCIAHVKKKVPKNKRSLLIFIQYCYRRAYLVPVTPRRENRGNESKQNFLRCVFFTSAKNAPIIKNYVIWLDALVYCSAASHRTWFSFSCSGFAFISTPRAGLRNHAPFATRLSASPSSPAQRRRSSTTMFFDFGKKKSADTSRPVALGTVKGGKKASVYRYQFFLLLFFLPFFVFVFHRLIWGNLNLKQDEAKRKPRMVSEAQVKPSFLSWGWEQAKGESRLCFLSTRDITGTIRQVSINVAKIIRLCILAKTQLQ